MKTLRMCLLGGAWLASFAGASAGGGKNEGSPEAPPLAALDASAAYAAARGAEVLRAVAIADARVTERRAAHLSTAMGKIRGGGMVVWASCRQPFSVTEALAGGKTAKERDIAYSFTESTRGFPLPHRTRPVAKGEKVVLVLGGDGSLVKIIPDTDAHRNEIKTIADHVNGRPPAAQALLKAMRSFTLKIAYHGPKPDVHPSVWCTTSPRLPDDLPQKWLVMQNLSERWAHEALDHLVKTGGLKPETLRAEAMRPRPKEPFYTLALSADGVDEVALHLGWGKEAHARIDALRRAIGDESAIAKLLDSLKE